MNDVNNDFEGQQGLLPLLSLYKEKVVEYEREIGELKRRLSGTDAAAGKQQKDSSCQDTGNLKEQALRYERQIRELESRLASADEEVRKYKSALSQQDSSKEANNEKSVSYKWGWKTWTLFVLLLLPMSFLIYIGYRILSSPVMQLELFDSIFYLP